MWANSNCVFEASLASRGCLEPQVPWSQTFLSQNGLDPTTFYLASTIWTLDTVLGVRTYLCSVCVQSLVDAPSSYVIEKLQSTDDDYK